MRAAERAYAFTKARILDGRYDGGVIISEGDVARRVGLSRTPVREAFLRLEAEGLLRLHPKRGAMVIPVSVDEIKSVLQARWLIERHGVERAIGDGQGLPEQLHEVLAAQQRITDDGAIPEFVVSDRQFHRLLVATAGNAILLHHHDSLQDRQSRMGLEALARDAGLQPILADHVELTEAIVEKDRGLALSVLGRHLRGTLTLLLPHQSLDAIPGADD